MARRTRWILVFAALLLPAGRLPADGPRVVWSDQPVVLLPDQPKPQKYFQHT